MYKTGCKILTINGIIFIVLGLFLVFFNNTSLFLIFSWLVNPVFWGENEILSKGTLNFRIFTWSFIGMFHIIWGVFIFYVVRYGLMKRKEVWAWKCIAISVITWLLVDVYFSLLMGLYTISFNPVTIFFAALFIIPLIMTRDALKI